MSFSLDNFFGLADEPMMVTDLQGKLLTHNEQANKLLPAHNKSLADQLTLYDVTIKQDAILIERVLSSMAKGKYSDNVTVRACGDRSRTQWIEWNIKKDKSSQCLYWIGRDVTLPKRNEAFLEILESVTNTGVWELDTDDNNVYWSNKIHEIHETDSNTYTPEISQALSFYPEEAIPLLMDALAKQDSTGQPYNLNLPFITAKNRLITVNARGFTQQRDGIILRRYGTFSDVTEKLEQENEKRKLASRIALAVELSQFGIWEYDLTKQFLVWDDKMFDIYGARKSEFKGVLEDWEKAVLEEDLHRARSEFLSSMETGKHFISYFRIRTAEGEVRHIKALANNVYDDKNNLVSVIGVNSDITADVTQRQQLEDARIHAEAADKAKSKFLATMSHEIRTPLNGIIGSLQMLQQYPLPEKGDELTFKSLESAKSLLGIINDILDYTKITEDKIDLEVIDVDVRALLTQIIEEQSIICEDKGVKLSLDYRDTCPVLYKVDPTRLRQIVTNLVSNAIKFSPQGQVNVTVDSLVQDGETRLQLTVSDTGVGMSPGQLDKLFEPFVQADSSTTRKFGGTGLGLSIVKKLVDLMQGTIAVHSALDQGTRFNVSLPLQPCDDSVIPVNKQTVCNLIPDLTGKRVIIAEDNELNQILIELMVQETNAEVTLVDDGQGLVTLMEQQDYDIVLCNIHMPGMGGIEACKIIRQHNTSVPIFAFTANVMQEEVKHYLSIGFDDIIAKPVIRETLFEKLAALVCKDNK